MITVSLCMIVKDEENVLSRCLDSVKDLVDEIVIVDTGSTDQTKKIAKMYTEKVCDFKWNNDFAAARNYSFSQATKDYILWLDADDVIEGKDRTSFNELKSCIPPEVDSVMMNYHVDYDSSGSPTRTTRRNRLVKRKGFQWKGKVHEYLDVMGVIARSETAIHHKKLKKMTDRNLRIYRERLNAGENFSARDLLYYGNELVTHRLYEEALDTFDQFLSSEKGWVEDNLAACVQMGRCYGHLKNKGKQIEALLKTFIYTEPRSEVCCRLGEIFLNDYDDIEKAIFWYQLALTLEQPPEIIGLLNEPYTRTWLPHLQLSVCYERAGKLNEAITHCKKALDLHPQYYKIQHNLDCLQAMQDAKNEEELEVNSD